MRTVLWGDARGGKEGEISSEAGRSPPWPQVDRRAEERREIASPIGRLLIGPPRSEVIVAPTPNNGTGELSPPGAAPAPPAGQRQDGERAQRAGPMDRPATARFFQAASGDKGGAREASVFVIHDAQGTGTPSGLRRLAIDVSLHEASTALPDASYSRLTFNSGDLRLVFDDGLPLAGLPAGEYPRLHASSFIWVGPSVSDKAIQGKLDLSRATLTCARDYDLVKLRLRFHDLALAFTPTPILRPAREDCRVIEHPGGAVEDSRPILVAEFDPQHVMEEAVFRPEPPPLPDVQLSMWPDGIDKPGLPARDAIIAHLDSLDTAAKKKDFRGKIREAKRLQEKADKKTVFGTFAKDFEDAFKARKGLPEEQVHYIGPFALAPDAMALARAVQQATGEASIQTSMDEMFRRVADLLAQGLKNQFRPLEDPSTSPDPAELKRRLFQDALFNESLLERQEPLYGVFRTFWRDEVVKARSLAQRGRDQELLTDEEVADERLDEFLSPRNRRVDVTPKKSSSSSLTARLLSRR